MADTPNTTIIGIDYAVDHKKVGVAVGHLGDPLPSVAKVDLASDIKGGLVPYLLDTIKRSTRTLLALDAPLGWPRPLGGFLEKHKAGEYIPVPADSLVGWYHRFDRLDRVLGLVPLELLP